MSPEEIVRKLAAAQPPISSSMDGPCCALCDTYPSLSHFFWGANLRFEVGA